MPWYYVLTKPGNFPDCIESETTPPEEFFTTIAGPFDEEKDCVNCQTTGACGQASGSGSALVPPIPSSRYLCKSLEQLKFGRVVWGLQCNKTRVLAKEVGVKFARDYYVAGGCTDIVHAKFMKQRRWDRDIYVFGEGCCAGSGSESASSVSESSVSGSDSISASASASASASISGSSLSSGSLLSPASGVSGGSITGIVTACCDVDLPRKVYATVSSTDCTQYNGTYELEYVEGAFIEGCDVSQVWRNRPPYTFEQGCATNNTTFPPSIQLYCCDGLLYVSYQISALSEVPVGGGNTITARDCSPLFVQLESAKFKWLDPTNPFIVCCEDDLAVISVIL